MLEAMSFEQWRETLGPKVRGTQNLYHVLKGSLDFFVMLSSVIGLVGGYGQSNYAAANAFQDAFARSMASQGCPVRSLDLMGIESAGYVAEHSDSVTFLERQGIGKLVKLDTLLALLNHAVEQPYSRSLPQCQLSLGLALDESLDSNRRFDNKFLQVYFRNSALGGLGPKKDSSDITKALKGAKTKEEALKLALESIVAKLSELLAIPITEMSSNQSMSAYGADSLVAVEIRNWLGVYLHAEVQTLELLGSAIRELSATVVSRSSIVPSFDVHEGT